jgi:hypothetical protein
MDFHGIACLSYLCRLKSQNREKEAGNSEKGHTSEQAENLFAWVTLSNRSRSPKRARVRTRHLRNEMIYRDLATHHTSTTYDLVYIEQRSKGRGITFP